MKNKKIILLTVLFLGIGFATVSTILGIDAVIKIRNDENSFAEAVKFYDYNFPVTANGTIDEENTTGHTITFRTRDLRRLGDNVSLSYKIKNESAYDAYVTGITCYFIETSTVDEASTMISKDNEYIAIKPSKGFYPLKIAANSTSNATLLTVEQIKSFTGTEEGTRKNYKYQCKIDVTTDSEAEPTGDTLDEIESD